MRRAIVRSHDRSSQSPSRRSLGVAVEAGCVTVAEFRKLEREVVQTEARRAARERRARRRSARAARGAASDASRSSRAAWTRAAARGADARSRRRGSRVRTRRARRRPAARRAQRREQRAEAHRVASTQPRRRRARRRPPRRRPRRARRSRRRRSASRPAHPCRRFPRTATRTRRGAAAITTPALTDSAASCRLIRLRPTPTTPRTGWRTATSRRATTNRPILRFDDVVARYPEGRQGGRRALPAGRGAAEARSRLREGGEQGLRAGGRRVSGLAARRRGEEAARAARDSRLARRRRSSARRAQSEAGTFNGRARLRKRDLDKFRKLLHRAARAAARERTPRARGRHPPRSRTTSRTRWTPPRRRSNLAFLGRLRERERGLHRQDRRRRSRRSSNELRPVRELRRGDRRQAPRGAAGRRALHRLQGGAGEARTPDGMTPS